MAVRGQTCAFLPSICSDLSEKLLPLPQINNQTKELCPPFSLFASESGSVFVLTGLNYSPSPAVFTVLIQSAA